MKESTKQKLFWQLCAAFEHALKGNWPQDVDSVDPRIQNFVASYLTYRHLLTEERVADGIVDLIEEIKKHPEPHELDMI